MATITKLETSGKTLVQIEYQVKYVLQDQELLIERDRFDVDIDRFGGGPRCHLILEMLEDELASRRNRGQIGPAKYTRPDE